MAWTAQLTKAETNTVNANINITFQFTSDSGEVQTRVVPAFDWTDERIAIWAENVIQTLETRDETLAALKTKISSGPTPVQLPRDGFPTPEADAQKAAREQAQRISGLAQKVSQLTTLQAAASAGIIAADDPDLAAAQAVVSDAVKVVTATAKPASP